jgi:hypothetical protein
MFNKMEKKVSWAKKGIIYTYSNNSSQEEKVVNDLEHHRIYKKAVSLRRSVLSYYYTYF